MSMTMILRHVSPRDLAKFDEDGLDPDEVLELGAPGTLDIHKSWHLLHFLFTGSAWDGKLPAATLLTGGREVGDDLGYGPARVVSPRETADFAKFLSGLKADDLKTRVNLAALRQNDIYSADDDVAGVQEEIDAYFPELQAHVAAAAQSGQGLVIAMV